MLDYAADADALGKNLGDDLAEGKATLPLIHAIAHSDDATRAALRNAVEHGDVAAMPQVELVLAIGQHAQAYHLGSRRKASMTETVAHWRDTFLANDSPRVLPLPHPSWRNSAWLKRHPWFEENVLPQLRRSVEMLSF